MNIQTPLIILGWLLAGLAIFSTLRSFSKPSLVESMERIAGRRPPINLFKELLAMIIAIIFLVFGYFS